MTRAWTSSGVLPFSGVVNVGGAALLYTRHAAKGGQELRITALDPASGKQLWQDAASPADVVRGIAMSVDEVGDRVAYYRPAGGKTDLVAALVIADPRTGRKLAVSQPRNFSSPPAACGDDPDTVCASAWNEASGRWENYRFGDAGSRLVPDTATSTARQVGSDGLVDLGSRTPERLGRIRDGRVVWSRPLADYFGEDATTDAGWSFDLHSAEDVYVGSVGHRRWLNRTLDLALSRTAGLSAADGKPLWSDTGTDLTCMGSLILAEPVPLDQPETVAESHPLRCRYTGTLKLGESGERASATDVTVALERFDVRTGKALWSTALGSAPVLAAAGGSAALVDDTHVVVDTGTQRLVVDLKTGGTAPATPATHVWCRPESKIRYPVPTYPENEPVHDVSGSGLTFPCTLDGKPVTTPVNAVPSNVAATFPGDLALYASPQAVVAYRAT